MRHDRGGDFVFIHQWGSSPGDTAPLSNPTQYLQYEHPQCGNMSFVTVTSDNKNPTCPLHRDRLSQTQLRPPPFDVPPPLEWNGPAWQVPFTLPPFDVTASKKEKRRPAKSKKSKKKKKPKKAVGLDEVALEKTEETTSFEQELQRYQSMNVES
jgi:hypothetical protein